MLLKEYVTVMFLKEYVTVMFLKEYDNVMFLKEYDNDNSRANQNGPTFNQLFEINELKAQSQEKDTVIRKLKDRINPLSGKDNVENVKKDIDEIETKNIELEHTLKNILRKLKLKFVVDTAVSKPIVTTIAPGMFNLDIEPISYRLKNNRDAHEVYLQKTIENTDTLCRLIECDRKQNPSGPLLESACMFTKQVQELLVDVSKKCPNLPKPSEKLVSVTPLHKDKRVRFIDPLTSLSNTQKQVLRLKYASFQISFMLVFFLASLESTLSEPEITFTSSWLVPSCCVIFDLEPFFFLTMTLILRSLNLYPSVLIIFAILCLDQHAHTLHHLESLLRISPEAWFLRKDL
nr:hypothetical protein [Tanacetum cinerariifolium]